MSASFPVQPTRDAEGWGELSTELWACIFSLLKPDLNTTIADWDLKDLTLKEQEQARFHALQIVCKPTKAAFVQHQHLHSSLVLGSQFHQTHLPKLLQWIHINGTSVYNVVTTCGSPVIDVVLSCLHSQGSRLTTVSLSNINTATSLLLHVFDFITSCQLQPPTGQTLSLLALSALPKLASLILLSGRYTHLNAAERLTALTLLDGHASCYSDSEAATSLQHIKLSNATILRFHEYGLSACILLRSLWCENGFIEARLPVDDFSSGMAGTDLPASLSELTALTVKSRYRNRGPPRFSCDMLAQLPNLSHLCIFCPAELIKLPGTLSRLSKLTHIEVTGGTIDVCLTWSDFASLASVTLSRLSWTEHLEGLVVLNSLQKVQFVQGTIDPVPSTTKQLVQFAHRMSAERPDVEVVFASY